MSYKKGQYLLFTLPWSERKRGKTNPIIGQAKGSVMIMYKHKGIPQTCKPGAVLSVHDTLEDAEKCLNEIIDEWNKINSQLAATSAHLQGLLKRQNALASRGLGGEV